MGSYLSVQRATTKPRAAAGAELHITADEPHVAAEEPHAESLHAGSIDAAVEDLYCARHGLRYELLLALFGLTGVMGVSTSPAGLMVDVQNAAHLARVRRQVLDLCTPFCVVVNSAGGGAAAVDDASDPDDDMRREFLDMYRKMSRGRIFAKPGLQEFCVAYGQRDNSTHLLLLNALRRAHRGVQRVWLSEDGKAACLEVDAAAEDAVVEAVLRDLTPVHVYLLPRGPVIRLDSGASADAVQPSIELDEGPTRHQTVAAQFALVRALIDTQPTQRNFFCSPASLYAALCAAALAATPSSETAAQLLRLFGPVTSPLAAARASGMIGTAIPNLHVANALFFFAPHGGASSVNDAFAESLSAQMGAHALPARSASDVNARCEAQTHGALRQVLTDRDVTSDTVMVLVNAVLFRGKWRFPFKLRNSKELALWTSDTVRDQRAVFMSKGFGAYGKDAKRLHAGVVGDGTAACARAVCVPYADVDAEAWFILPEEPGDAALGRVGRALPQLWDDIEALHAAEPRVVDLTCPRFNIDTGCMDVVPALRALGAKAPFEPCAGFLNATPDRTACLTAVAQRISCTVDETGTVAAGCSAAVICTRGFGGSSWAPEAFEVELTRPFWIVLIVRISGGIVPMFIGRVMTPSAA